MRFINFYTKEGGTYASSLDFATDINAWHLHPWQGDEKDLTDDMLRGYQIFNIFTPLEHNDVLSKTKMFHRLVLTSPFFKK